MPDEYKLQLYLTRHGETWGNLPPLPESELNPEIHGTRHDPELTPLGRHQAQLLGERLRVVRFAAVFSSPLIRAVGTAYETTVRQLGEPVPIEIIPDLAEIGTPWNYEGVPFKKLQCRYPNAGNCPNYQKASADWDALEAENKEEAYLLRAKNCITYFRNRFQNGESIFVVAHGSFNTFLTRAALGLSNQSDFNFCQENTGLTKIKYFLDDTVRLSYSNDTSHLYAENPQITRTL